MRITTCAVLAVLGLAAVGCETVNTVERGEPMATKQTIKDKRIITDATLNERARVVEVNEGRTNDGLLQIQVTVHNKSNSTHNFFYRFEWYDQSGMVVNPTVGNWVETQIAGKDSHRLVGIAPQKNVVDFRLVMKER